MCRDLPGGQSFGIQRQHDLIDPGPPARSRGTSISTCPVASVRTVFGGVPLRILVESGSSEARQTSRASRTSSSCALLRRGIRSPPSPLIFSQRVGAGNTVSGTVPWLDLLLLVGQRYAR